MKYLLIDTSNLFYRARHSVHKNTDAFTKVGFSLHLIFNTINKMQRKFDADHIMFGLEGNNNWRKSFYEPYKKNRLVAKAKRTPDEVEEDELFLETYNELCEYLKEKTNCTILQHNDAEADDVIARWIALHPDDEHYIISTDSDYHQLISENVHQYNGVADTYVTLDGYFNYDGEKIYDKKTNEHKKLPDPKWVLFEKCIRGDTSDNIFSAYPGVRKKGTKNKAGLLDAFDDINDKGYAWNSIMQHIWVDHNDTEHKVLDDYERNKHLIDLNAQPQSIIDAIDEMIIMQLRTEKNVQMAGIKFIKFCAKHDLKKLAEFSNVSSEWLNAKYKGDLISD